MQTYIFHDIKVQMCAIVEIQEEKKKETGCYAVHFS